MTEDELRAIEDAERAARYRAYRTESVDARMRARDAELESGRAGMGDYVDD